MPWSKTISEFLLEDEDALSAEASDPQEVLGVDSAPDMFRWKHPKRSGEMSRHKSSRNPLAAPSPTVVLSARGSGAA